MTQDELWFWLCGTEEVFRNDIGRLLAVFSGPEEIFKAGAQRLVKAEP